MIDPRFRAQRLFLNNLIRGADRFFHHRSTLLVAPQLQKPADMDLPLILLSGAERKRFNLPTGSPFPSDHPDDQMTKKKPPRYHR